VRGLLLFLQWSGSVWDPVVRCLTEGVCTEGVDLPCRSELRGRVARKGEGARPASMLCGLGTGTHHRPSPTCRPPPQLLSQPPTCTAAGTATLCATRWAHRTPSSRCARPSRGTSGSWRCRRRSKQRRPPRACSPWGSSPRWVGPPGVVRCILGAGLCDDGTSLGWLGAGPVLGVAWLGAMLCYHHVRIETLRCLNRLCCRPVLPLPLPLSLQMKSKVQDALTINWLPPLGSTGEPRWGGPALPVLLQG